jgi:hypothetical protein
MVMMLRIGRITGSEIAPNRDGEDNVRLLQVEVTDADDVQTVEQIRGTGDDQNPQDDTAVIIADLGPAWKIALGIDDGVEPTMAVQGERQIYSYDVLRTIQAFIRLLVDGTIHINGDADFAVRFNELETAFNQLKTDHDDFADVMNNHIHATTATVGAGPAVGVISKPTGPAPEYTPSTPGAPGVQSSSADIAPAKVEDVKLTGYTP